RHRPEELQRAFFSTRFARILDPLGYARLMNWRLYAEEALAKRDVALWLGGDTLSVEYAGKPSPATRSSTGPVPEVSGRSGDRSCSRPLTSEAGRNCGFSVW